MSGDVVKMEPAHTAPAPIANDGAVILTMIDKLISRPDVPVEKLEQMFALHQKVQAEAARKSFLAAFAALQSGLPAAVRAGRGHNDKAYARYEDVAEALRQPFAQHGFSHWFTVDQTDGKVKVTTNLGHCDGHVESSALVLPLDTSGNKNAIHAMGSTISYGKRYGLLTVSGIATGDDDDGKKLDDKPTDAKLEDIFKLIDETKSERTWFLEKYSVESFDDLTGKQRNEIKSGLTAKLAHMRMQRNG
jgi:hypothetical protein